MHAAVVTVAVVALTTPAPGSAHGSRAPCRAPQCTSAPIPTTTPPAGPLPLPVDYRRIIGKTAAVTYNMQYLTRWSDADRLGHDR